MSSLILPGFGGLATPLVTLLELNNVPKTQRPDFKDLVYWIPYFIGPILGAAMGFLYFHNKSETDYLLSFHIGVSAPLIIRSLAESRPKGIV